MAAVPVPRHKTAKEPSCEVSGCKDNAIRSIPRAKAGGVLQNLTGTGRKLHLCKKHYREYKKKTRAERKLETMRWR